MAETKQKLKSLLMKVKKESEKSGFKFSIKWKLVVKGRVFVWFLGRAQAASLVDRLVSGPHRVRGNLYILGTLFQ